MTNIYFCTIFKANVNNIYCFFLLLFLQDKLLAGNALEFLGLKREQYE